MNKKIILPMLCALLLGVSSCTPSDGSSTPGGESSGSSDVTLTYWCFNNQVSDFERRFVPFTEQTGIKVNVQGIQASTWAECTQEIVNAAYSGTLPDCADMASESMSTLVKYNLIDSIDSYMTRDQAEIQESLDEMHPMLRDAHKHNGHYYSLPTIWNTPIMYFNKNVLKAAGITETSPYYPHEGWTIDDFLHCCYAITKNNKSNSSTNVYGLKVQNQYFYSIEPWLNSFGTSVLNSSWTDTTIASQEAKDCFSFLFDLINNNDVTKKVSPELGGTDEYELFFSNRVGFMIMGIPYVYSLYHGGFNDSLSDINNLREGYDVITLPTVDGVDRALAGVGATAIFSQSQHKEEAWKLAKYLSSKKFQDEFLSNEVWAMPSINSAIDLLCQKEFFPENGDVFTKALNNGSIVPAPENYSSIELDVRNWFSGFVSEINGYTIEGDGPNSLNGLASKIRKYL